MKRWSGCIGSAGVAITATRASIPVRESRRRLTYRTSGPAIVRAHGARIVCPVMPRSRYLLKIYTLCVEIALLVVAAGWLPWYLGNPERANRTPVAEPAYRTLVIIQTTFRY
jgi:hypothetical protein